MQQKPFEAAVEWCDPQSLIPYANNTKTHPPDQIARIAASIAAFGFDQPIVIDERRVIIKGHGRYLASLQLGLQKVPVVVRTDLTPAEVKAARIADNKSAESPWDEELLRLELQSLEEHDFDLESLASRTRSWRICSRNRASRSRATPMPMPSRKNRRLQSRFRGMFGFLGTTACSVAIPPSSEVSRSCSLGTSPTWSSQIHRLT